jgi:hypothetical protein
MPDNRVGEPRVAARLLKLKYERAMWKSGGVKTESVSTNAPIARSGLRGPYRILIIMAVLFVTVVLIFPLVFRPRVEPPGELQFGSAFSVVVPIANHNMTPLSDVEYSCEISKLTLADGSAVTDARVLTRGAIPKIPGRKAVAAHCGIAYIVTHPLKAAEYKLTLTYRAYPWRRIRTSVYYIDARIGSNGQVTGWTAN